MNNPINNTVFDSRNLIEYREHLENELVDLFNDYIREHNETAALEEGEETEEISDFSEVGLNLEGFRDRFTDEVEHYEKLRNFCDELSNFSDYQHGLSIIHEFYFEDYCKDMLEDCGDLPKNLPSYIENNINWEGVAEDLKVDYSTVSYDGDDYYVR